jgi:hypothetical protein
MGLMWIHVVAGICGLFLAGCGSAADPPIAAEARVVPPSLQWELGQNSVRAEFH